LSIAMLVFCIAPFAQAQTLVIHATQGNLNEIIEADTLAGGTQAHDVYQLVSLDTTYKFSGAITATQDITVIGVVDPVTGRPPCIQPAVLQDQSIPPTIFTLNGTGIHGTFMNLYLLAKATNNTANADGIAIQVSADNVKLTVDNCVFDGWQSFAIGYNANWDDFFIHNSHFRNMVHPNQWYIGEIIRNEWPGEAYTDTMSFVGNTMLCINGYAAAPVTKYYQTYFEFVNNRVLYTFKNPFFIFNATKAKINDNVFYSNYSGGVDQTEHPWWDNLWLPDSTYGVIALEPLSLATAKIFCPSDSSDPNILSIAESQRTVEVLNNTYFWPTAVVNLWTNWNNTQANWIRIPMWMNEPTIAMFANDTDWPGLTESGNVNADPGYMSAIDPDILNGTTGNDIGFLAYFEQVRLGTAATDVWGYSSTQVSGAADWTPIWPLEEFNSIPYGIDDEHTSPVPSGFTLSNVYPNPFNPSTNVEYALNKSGVTGLKVYNVLGQLIMTPLDNVTQNAGTYKISIDMSGFPSGIYMVVLSQGNNLSIQKMMLLK
jgi:hypothetical protein